MDEPFDISRFMYAFSQKQIKIKILKEVPEYVVGDTTYGPFRVGATIELPRWQASELIEQGAAEPAQPLTLDISLLETALLNEQQQSPLQPLPPDFYMRFRSHMQIINKQKSKAPDPTIAALAERSQSIFDQILELRLNKIFRILSLQDTRDFQKKMTT
ncbi:MAG: DNA replication complex subunit Gins51, partial [Candidatus Ranarchaeia archaeon]